MKKTRVALDACVPERMVSLLKAGFADQGYEFFWEPEFASPKATDEFWADAFRRFGGEIVISADKMIACRPHQIGAFEQNGLKSFFLGSRWQPTTMRYKAAHLMFWWPKIATVARQEPPGRSFWVPIEMVDKSLKRAEVPHDAASERAARQVP